MKKAKPTAFGTSRKINVTKKLHMLKKLNYFILEKRARAITFGTLRKIKVTKSKHGGKN